MSPTLKSGQIVFAWHSRNFKPGQVVIAFVKGKEVIKRIESVNRGQIFLKGDNTSSSTDSRTYGSIPDTKVDAVVIWPRVQGDS